MAQPDTADRTALMAGETTLTIIGNLTEDPQLRSTSQGQPVVNVTVASTQRPFDRDVNEWRDGETLFLPATAWRQRMSTSPRRCTRGTGPS